MHTFHQLPKYTVNFFVNCFMLEYFWIKKIITIEPDKNLTVRFNDDWSMAAGKLIL